MRVDTMVVLKEYNILSEAEKVKAWLDEVGMWCMVNSEYMSTSTSREAARTQLITRQDDLARALEIIAAHEEPKEEELTESEYKVY